MSRIIGMEEWVAKAAANVVWNKMKSGNVRDCVKIGRMAKSIDDVNFIVDAFWMRSDSK